MNADRLKSSPGDVPLLAVAVTIPPGASHTHSGVVHRDEEAGKVYLLHLRFHHDLANEEADGAYLFALPDIPDEDAQIIAGHCRLIARRHPRIPFGLRVHLDSQFDPATAELNLPTGVNGLNCVTFVLAVFQRAGPQIIDLTGWPERPQDAAWHERLVRWLRDRASPEHVAAVEKDKGCVRVRPEELAGACLEIPLPTTFPACATNGGYIRCKLEQHTGRFCEPWPRPTIQTPEATEG